MKKKTKIQKSLSAFGDMFVTLAVLAVFLYSFYKVLFYFKENFNSIF